MLNETEGKQVSITVDTQSSIIEIEDVKSVEHLNSSIMLTILQHDSTVTCIMNDEIKKYVIETKDG